MSYRIMFGTVLFFCVVCLCWGSRVLVISPVPSRSHQQLTDSIVKTLLDAGHEVTYINRLTEIKRKRLKVITVRPEDGQELDVNDLIERHHTSHKTLELGVVLAKQVIKNEKVRELLKDNQETFDTVIAEWYYSGLLAPLAAVFECPLIWYTACDASWMTSQLMLEQTSPVYSTDLLSSEAALPPYGFRERVMRLARQVYLSGWITYMIHYVESPAYYELYQLVLQHRGLSPSQYETVLYNASLLLINSDPEIGQILPLPPNAKYVGGHHIELPSKALPQNLQDLLDNAKHGAILFSADSKILPWYVKRTLLHVFSQFDQITMWETGEQLTDIPDNVYVFKQLPRFRVLNHNNTVLLITNGGTTSLLEAAYFGVPVIGIPLYQDQFVTMDLAHARRRGIKVKFSEHIAQKIKDSVNKILSNNSYHKNAEKVSIYLQSTLEPQRQILHWIELVIKTGGAPQLRSPAFLQLTTLQMLNIDVLLLLFMFVWFLSKVLKVIQVHWRADVLDNKKND